MEVMDGGGTAAMKVKENEVHSLSFVLYLF
jgi:hypothetical protein